MRFSELTPSYDGTIRIDASVLIGGTWIYGGDGGRFVYGAFATVPLDSGDGDGSSECCRGSMAALTSPGLGPTSGGRQRLGDSFGLWCVEISLTALITSTPVSGETQMRVDG